MSEKTEKLAREIFVRRISADPSPDVTREAKLSIRAAEAFAEILFAEILQAEQDRRF